MPRKRHEKMARQNVSGTKLDYVQKTWSYFLRNGMLLGIQKKLTAKLWDCFPDGWVLVGKLPRWRGCQHLLKMGNLEVVMRNCWICRGS